MYRVILGPLGHSKEISRTGPFWRLQRDCFLAFSSY